MNEKINALLEQSKKIDDQSKNHLVPAYQITISEDGAHLVMDGEAHPMMEDAQDGIMAVLRTALSTLPERKLAEIGNLILANTPGNVRLRTYQDAAVVSVNSGNYREIGATEFLRMAVEAMEADFGELLYLSSTVSVTERRLLVAVPSLEKPLMDALHEAGMDDWTEAQPVVEVYTSDAGRSAAAFQPMIKMGNYAIPFCKPLGAKHRGNGDWTREIMDAESEIMASLKKTASQIAWLSAQELRYAADTLIRVCKKLQIPVKWFNPAVDQLRLMELQAEEPLTALDCYLALQEAVNDCLEAEGTTGKRALSLKENLARAAFVDWQEFDIH